MTDPKQLTNLLQDIDERQNQVLDQLDELSAKVENLLKKWTRKGKKEGDPAQEG